MLCCAVFSLTNLFQENPPSQKGYNGAILELSRCCTIKPLLSLGDNPPTGTYIAARVSPSFLSSLFYQALGACLKGYVSLRKCLKVHKSDNISGHSVRLYGSFSCHLRNKKHSMVNRTYYFLPNWQGSSQLYIVLPSPISEKNTLGKPTPNRTDDFLDILRGR